MSPKTLGKFTLTALSFAAIRGCGFPEPHTAALRDGYLKNTSEVATSDTAIVVDRTGLGTTVRLSNGDEVHVKNDDLGYGKVYKGIRIKSGLLSYFGNSPAAYLEAR